MGGPERRVVRAGAIARRSAAAGLAWCLLTGSAAVRAALSGIPANPRLRRAVRSRRADRARHAAEAEVRARLAALTAAMPSARPAFTAFEDRAVREPRFVPRLFPPPKGTPPAPAALRATLHATAYLGFPSVREAVRELAAAGRFPDDDSFAGPGPRERVTRDLPDRPLPEHAFGSGQGRRVILYRAFVEPPGATVAAVRGRHGAVVRWTCQVTYLTVRRWPVLRRLAERSRGRGMGGG
ncbi:hypothetical protein [Streptomyces sp. HPF1205]|uniref:hypothetical protein n=1 Tax=Streptomyces sp. HPF1205 TaxID=2873262 RepID=UPI001CEDFD4B|nr:hypothetical protein [Streptomyces sp. HPF1205]